MMIIKEKKANARVQITANSNFSTTIIVLDITRNHFILVKLKYGYFSTFQYLIFTLDGVFSNKYYYQIWHDYFEEHTAHGQVFR